ncbi:30S ribosomal protein S5 [Candidatus Woesearchaeota archaeon]|nr:30S ribosomal protein S5 [Candidatus Woesearchaeota archaeon]
MKNKKAKTRKIMDEMSETKVSEHIQKSSIPNKTDEESSMAETDDMKKANKKMSRKKSRVSGKKEDKDQLLEAWSPRTDIGKKVKNQEIKELDYILDNGFSVLEPEIVDFLLPELEQDLISSGQVKGKFGGGARISFRRTQKKTQEGNKLKFSCMAVVGNKNGYVGLGFGKAKETVPARDKAFRKARLNIFKISRGCGSWKCNCKTPHSIPFAVEGKSGSVRIKLMPAPKGTGLVVEKECAKILGMAGIKDIWSHTEGQTKNKVNLIYACEKALKKLLSTKIKPQDIENLAIAEGKITGAEK